MKNDTKTSHMLGSVLESARFRDEAMFQAKQVFQYPHPIKIFFETYFEYHLKSLMWSKTH